MRRERAVLVTRRKMPPAQKIEAGTKNLEVAIANTAAPREAEAWGRLMARIDARRAAQAKDV